MVQTLEPIRYALTPNDELNGGAAEQRPSGKRQTEWGKVTVTVISVGYRCGDERTCQRCRTEPMATES